jgi:seryl-tRNA synthetase
MTPRHEGGVRAKAGRNCHTVDSLGTPPPGATSAEGLATLSAGQTRVLRLLDETFLSWALGHGAEELTPPPVLSTSAAARLDVFANFPHLVSAVTSLAPEAQPTAGHMVNAVPVSALTQAAWILPSSVCFGVYLAYAGTSLSGDLTVTALGRCYRNEASYEGLRRLRSFQMREVVAVGSHEHALYLVDTYKDLTTRLAGALGIPMEVGVAGDPFFDPKSSRALMQKLAPVKQEFVCQGTALASVNVHRNFFGERCGIRLHETDEYAFTSCIGWGYERWLHALSVRYDEDWDEACEGLEQARCVMT